MTSPIQLIEQSEDQEPTAKTSETVADDAHATKAEKRFAIVFSIGLLLVVLSPVVENFRSKPTDSFPLSYYPMFSKDRPDLATVSYVVAIDANGRESFVPYKYVGRGGMNQMRKQIRRAVKRGDANELCARAVKNIERRNPKSLENATQLAVVTGRFRLSDYREGAIVPESRVIEAIMNLHGGER